jgi:hypothetical protein
MSASVSLAVSKMIYPETERSQQGDPKSFKFASRSASSSFQDLNPGQSFV